jgi:hypothetical protein
MMGHLVQLDRDRVETDAPPIGQRAGHLLDQPLPRLRQTKVHRVGAYRLGGEDCAVQDQMRRPRHERLVFLAGRLAFHAVGDDHRGAPPGGDGLQLGAGGERRAAPAGQSGFSDGIHQAAEVPSAPAPGQRAVDLRVLAKSRGVRAVPPACRQPYRGFSSCAGSLV